MSKLSPQPRHQRAFGRGELVVQPVAGATRLDRLYQEGCAKIRLPRPIGDDAEAVLINTAGGLTGGDRVYWQMNAAAGTRLTLTTQAAERVYRSLGDAAEVETHLNVGAGASLEWLPQETILYDGSRLSRRLEVDLAPGARFLGLEAVLLGREAMGEEALSARLTDNWRIRRDGRLVHAEATRLEPDALARTGSSLLAGNRAFASVVYLAADAETHLAALRSLDLPYMAASAREDKLVVRLLAPTGLALRRVITPIIGHLNRARSLPRLWTF